MTSLRIVVLPADTSACGTLRLFWPSAVVQQIRPDWKIEVYRPGDVQFGGNARGELVATRGLPDPESVDVLVMQRVGSNLPLRFIQYMQSIGCAVVLDADDAMWAIDRANTAYAAWNGSTGQHWRTLDKAAEAADLVTVTTEALAKRYGAHGRVEVLPNRVPASALTLPSRRDEYDQTVTIGWAGFTATHPRDLLVVGNAVQRVVEDTGCRVRVVGDAEGASAAWGVDVEQVAPEPLGPGYYGALTTLDIGLVPLEDSSFNRAKSSLKVLEMASQGLAVVATPTPANREIVQSGVPALLAASPAEWREHLTRLVTDPQERRERAETGRAAVADGWTVEGRAQSWALAWERAANRRRRLAA